jgi:hypothetical protein
VLAVTVAYLLDLITSLMHGTIRNPNETEKEELVAKFVNLEYVDKPLLDRYGVPRSSYQVVVGYKGLWRKSILNINAQLSLPSIIGLA